MQSRHLEERAAVRRAVPVQLTCVEAEETDAVEIRRGTGEKGDDIGQGGDRDARAAQTKGFGESIGRRLG